MAARQSLQVFINFPIPIVRVSILETLYYLSIIFEIKIKKTDLSLNLVTYSRSILLVSFHPFILFDYRLSSERRFERLATLRGVRSFVARSPSHITRTYNGERLSREEGERRETIFQQVSNHEWTARFYCSAGTGHDESSFFLSFLVRSFVAFVDVWRQRRGAVHFLLGRGKERKRWKGGKDKVLEKPVSDEKKKKKRKNFALEAKIL